MNTNEHEKMSENSVIIKPNTEKISQYEIFIKFKGLFGGLPSKILFVSDGIVSQTHPK